METVYKKPGTGGIPELAGALTASTIITSGQTTGGNGYSRLWVTLKGAVDKRGIKVLLRYNTGQRTDSESRDQRDSGVKAEHKRGKSSTLRQIKRSF